MNGELDPIPSIPRSEGAARALEGYFYQLDVSILMALDLVLARKVARSMILEPASHEDLETDIEREPGVLAEAIELDAYRLVIQCKLRTTGPWKREGLMQVLTHGTRRASAADRLLAPNVRYVLVTNADVDGAARALCISEVGVWPSTAQVSNAIARAFPLAASGRVAVLSLMDTEKVSVHTERLLTDRFRLPRTEIAACRRVLQQEALLRMRGAGEGIWTREELASILITHGGFLGRSEDLVGFVPPTNWTHLKETLSREHAVIIAGPSGTGKTRTAKALIAGLRDQLPGVKVVYVSGGPEKIKQERARPVVFEVEDPWGKYRLEPNSVPWNDAIGELLRSAGPERKFVITSRSDVLRESGPKRLRARWVVHLEPEHYRRKDRTRLLVNRLKSLPRGQQSLLKQYWKEAVDQLQTPLELDRYVDGVSEGLQRFEFEDQFIHRCIQEAHRDSIERSIVQNVRKREDWRWAAVVWGLFKAHERLSFAVLPLIQSELSRRDPQFDDGLSPYVNFLIAGRHLRQSESVLSYQHPRVELGLELALNEKPQLASRTLSHLVETLAAKDLDPEGDWGLEGAARLMYAAHFQSSLNVELNASTQSVLDRWLQARLAAAGLTFEDDVYLAVAVGSRSCPVAELARWLTHGWELPGIKEFPGIKKMMSGNEMWQVPEVPAQWYEWIRADPATRSICEAFIRRFLPLGRGYIHYPTSFVDHLRKLVPDSSAAFRDAALAIIKDRDNSNAEVIAYGTLADLDAFEPVLPSCLDHQAWLEGKFDDEWLALANGESDEPVEYYIRHLGEEEYSVDVLVFAYVRERRRVRGWTALRDHLRAVDLLYAWLYAIGNDGVLEDQELLVVARLARHIPQEADFWKLAASHWRAALIPVLRSRIIEGGEDDATLQSMLRTLILRMPSEVPGIAAVLLSHGNMTRLFAIAARFKILLKQSGGSIWLPEREQIHAVVEVFTAILPAPISDVIRTLAVSAPLNGSQALAILVGLDAGRDHELKLVQARVLAAHEIDVSELIADLLTPRCNSDAEIEISTSAVKIAVEAKLWDCVENALHHRFAGIRKEALLALAACASGPLPPQILCLATDKSYHVRQALMSILKERSHSEHADALIELAADRWTPHGYHPEFPVQYPVAQQAAQMLRELPPMDVAHAKQLSEIATKAEDPDLVRTLFEILFRSSSDEVRQSVVRMALGTGGPPYHRIAALALWNQVEHVTEAMISKISVRHLLRRAPEIALHLTRLVGTRATVEQVLASGRALAAHAQRRVLVVPLYLSVGERTDSMKSDLLRDLLSMLPDNVAIVLRRAVEGDEKLAPDALDALGDGDIVAQVKWSFWPLFRDSSESW